VGGSFQDDGFLKQGKDFAESSLKDFVGDDSTSQSVSDEFSLAPLVASVIACRSKSLRILDVGGGFGIGYVALKSCLAAHYDVQYHVLEIEKVVANAATMFPDDASIKFHHQLPANGELTELDLVVFCSSLQYIEDYRAFLQEVF